MLCFSNAGFVRSLLYGYRLKSDLRLTKVLYIQPVASFTLEWCRKITWGGVIMSDIKNRLLKFHWKENQVTRDTSRYLVCSFLWLWNSLC